MKTFPVVRMKTFPVVRMKTFPVVRMTTRVSLKYFVNDCRVKFDGDLLLSALDLFCEFSPKNPFGILMLLDSSPSSLFAET